MYKLFYSPGACSMAPHIVLEEIGVPYDVELVSTKDQTSTPAWKAVNPKGRVPALLGVPGSIGGTKDLLTEAAAIMFYLASSHPAAKLMPTDPAGQARCIEWTNWLSGGVHAQTYGQIWRTYRFSDDKAVLPSIAAKGKSNQAEQYAYIEFLLADGRDWAVPGGYTYVDAYLLLFYLWGLRSGLDMAAKYPAWTRLKDKVLARPAVQRVLKQEGISI